MIDPYVVVCGSTFQYLFDVCKVTKDSIVTKDVGDGDIVAGIPAKKISTVTEYEEKHRNELVFIADYPFDKKKEILLQKDR